MAKKIQNLTVTFSNERLLAQDRHTDWQIRQEQGGNLYGRRARGGAGFQGASKTRKGQAKKACRGKVSF
jgi:hypothetical protein